MNANKPILVTGMPRSGTTWVGRVIELAPSVRYVHEPFNISSQYCSCGVKFDYWFYYLCPENIHYFHSHLKHTLSPAFTRAGLVNSLSELKRTGRVKPLTKYISSYFRPKPLLKDPIAVFSVDQLAASLNMDVVVVIRHPAAIVSSYKTLNWTHPFSHFLNQPLLIRNYLASYQSEIEDFSQNEYDIVDQAALLWKLIYFVIAKNQEIHPEWVFIRYEDLAQDPITGFINIFNKLNLRLSKHTRHVIQSLRLHDQSPSPPNPYSIKRNPNQVMHKWKKHLTPAEILRVHERVQDVSSFFYPEDSWAI